MKIGKWLAAPMKKSIGIESQAFVREARNARRAHAGLIGRRRRRRSRRSPCVAAMIFFWSGQMIIQTFMNMIVPMPPPIMIDERRGWWRPAVRAMSEVASADEGDDDHDRRRPGRARL